jgi:hypothetical protein
MKRLVIVSGDRQKTKFMQDANLFEDFKVVAMPPIILEVNIEDEIKFKEVVDYIINFFKSSPYLLVAMVEKRSCPLSGSNNKKYQ